ncbi:uncharacterized protein LOC135465605 [Liolophura sinensis]|uniref:uncharacterized protein LOC135465605 n=1 Tax=Liolophura sinensis TaxID=3198878 RepID=UPI003158E7B0
MEESERDLSCQGIERQVTGTTPGFAKVASGKSGYCEDCVVDSSVSAVSRSPLDDDSRQDSADDEEPMKILCEPDRRQVKLTTALPLTGRSNRNQTNSGSGTSGGQPRTVTTELDRTPSVTVTGDGQRQKSGKQTRANSRTDTIVIQYNNRYLRSCPGIFRVLQVSLSMICLISLTTSGSGKYESYLLLPLSWHFRIMVFVLVLTILTSLVMLVTYTTGLITTFPLNWPLLDLVLYGTFTFLYLVGSSLVASAFDFYQKMGTDVPEQTIRRLVLCVVLGYMAMFLYLATAVHGYKKWRWLELHQFRRQRLMEADEIA